MTAADSVGVLAAAVASLVDYHCYSAGGPSSFTATETTSASQDCLEAAIGRRRRPVAENSAYFAATVAEVAVGAAGQPGCSGS